MHGFRISFFVLIPCNLHEKTNSDWLKIAHIDILSNQRVSFLEICFRANYTEQKLIRNPCIVRIKIDRDLNLSRCYQ